MGIFPSPELHILASEWLASNVLALLIIPQDCPKWQTFSPRLTFACSASRLACSSSSNFLQRVKAVGRVLLLQAPCSASKKSFRHSVLAPLFRLLFEQPMPFCRIKRRHTLCRTPPSVSQAIFTSGVVYWKWNPCLTVISSLWAGQHWLDFCATRRLIDSTIKLKAIN